MSRRTHVRDCYLCDGADGRLGRVSERVNRDAYGDDQEEDGRAVVSGRGVENSIDEVRDAEYEDGWESQSQAEGCKTGI